MKNNRKDKKANLESDDAQKPDIDAATDQSEKRNVLRRANEVNEDESTVSSDEDDYVHPDQDDPEISNAPDVLEETESLRDQLLRALAEVENVRKRADRDREEASKYGITSFARDIVSIADNLKRALESVPNLNEREAADNPITKSLQEGISLTQQELESVLARHGIERIEPLGEVFDHNYHQAMFELDNEDQPAGTVVQVLQPGYKIHDRLLRPAMVGVVKKRPIEPKPEG